MMQNKERKSLTECFSDFVGDSEGLSREELDIELRDHGIDVIALEHRVAEIVRKGSEERRLDWRKRAAEKRAAIETFLSSRKMSTAADNVRNKVLKILEGGYGQGALKAAEAYFRKADSFSDKDLESLIEDLEDLNLLDKSNGGKL
jgi:hypothetical protein